jgi:hypothetical protein
MGNSRILNITAGVIHIETIWFQVSMSKAQDRDKRRTLAHVVKNLRVPLNEQNLLASLEPVGFSRRTLLHGVRNK